ncbi:MAG: nucleotide sugar dehydrogenase [Candidatus Marsarchaeota archaeon]|nr:nucleotide sugar dehydrogenase [Candidatus Marsarchaeota archaeon]
MHYDICVVGGFGHVGLPLSLVFADRGMKVCAFDINEQSNAIIAKGEMPFFEDGAEPLLKKVLKNKSLTLSLDASSISDSDVIIVTIGTPVDSHSSPELNVLEKAIHKYLSYFRDDQLLVLRSTAYPGTTTKIQKFFDKHDKNVDVSFCPERIVQGHAVKELSELPQIVSSVNKKGLEKAKKLFGLLTDDIVVLEPTEAEYAKLFTNAWRYIKFSAANQFFMLTNEAGIDFAKVYKGLTHNYKRALDLPFSGLAAGPCLFKDTAQLSASNNHEFALGRAAVQVNEGMPFYIVKKLRQNHDVKNKTVGILGMAFKADIDDTRDSLSYKLKDLLEFEAKQVYCSDPYVNNPDFISADELVNKSDIVILATPHKAYKQLQIGKDKELIDVWNFFGNGSLI